MNIININNETTIAPLTVNAMISKLSNELYENAIANNMLFWQKIMHNQSYFRSHLHNNDSLSNSNSFKDFMQLNQSHIDDFNADFNIKINQNDHNEDDNHELKYIMQNFNSQYTNYNIASNIHDIGNINTLGYEIAHKIHNNIYHFNFNLTPPAIGHIIVGIKFHHDKCICNITTENKLGYNKLKSYMRGMQKIIQSNSIENIEININQNNESNKQ